MGDLTLDSCSTPTQNYLYTSSSASSAHTFQFVSLRCKPTLNSLPPELLSRIAFYLSLCEYSYLSRTNLTFHTHLFRPAEVVLFLKTRYRLSIESGSIIIFSYLANMQVKAPMILERIFDDFFMDSPLRLEEERLWKEQQLNQRQLMSNNTFQLNHAIAAIAGAGGQTNSSSMTVQRMESVQTHQTAEQARRRAKWDAVRMLGVLYALDKTHVGPSSSTNALVLSGASDITDLPPPPAPVPLKVLEPVSTSASASVATTSLTPGSNLSADREPSPTTLSSSTSKGRSNPLKIEVSVVIPPYSRQSRSGASTSTDSNVRTLKSTKSGSASTSALSSRGTSGSAPASASSPSSSQISPSSVHGSRGNSLRRSQSQERMDLGDLIPKSSLLDSDPLRYYIQRRSHHRKRRSPSASSFRDDQLTHNYLDGGRQGWIDPFDDRMDEDSWTPSSYPFSFGSTSSTSTFAPDMTKATTKKTMEDSGKHKELSKGKSHSKSRTPSPSTIQNCLRERFLREKRRNRRRAQAVKSSPVDVLMNGVLEEQEEAEEEDVYDEDEEMSRQGDEETDQYGILGPFSDEEYMGRRGFGDYAGEEEEDTCYETEEELIMEDDDYPKRTKSEIAIAQGSPSASSSLSSSPTPSPSKRGLGSSGKSAAKFQERLLADKVMENKMPQIANNTTTHISRRVRSRSEAFDSSSSNVSTSPFDSNSASSSHRPSPRFRHSSRFTDLPDFTAPSPPRLSPPTSPPTRHIVPLPRLGTEASYFTSSSSTLPSTYYGGPASSLPAAAVVGRPTAAPTILADTRSTYSRHGTQLVLNRVEKIAFLTKYTDRMHLKLQALGIKDWGQEDIQRKKTYQLMIQHNDKTGEKDLVQFYLGRYGGSIPQPEADEGVVVAAAAPGVVPVVDPVLPPQQWNAFSATGAGM
ncbi:hypothetical protein BGZ83_007088 [Gryganskiella cystojenkinii]|nr:hypothetical protein BGZ83_007088 [Gryganskiella cystojenkinii]